MHYLLALLLLSGCVTYQIDSAIDDYQAVADQIHLGDEKEKVLTILKPIQDRLGAKERKAPESYLKDGATVEIYFARSGRQPDGLTTDDEFTPYVFTNGKLTAIGWTTLGGPRSVGQATSGSGGGRLTTTCHKVGNMTQCY